MFEKRLKYVENDVDYFTNGLKMLKMTEILEMAKILWKWLRYMEHGLSI